MSARACVLLALLASCTPSDVAPPESGASPSREPAPGVAERLPVAFDDAALRVVLTHSPVPALASDPTNAVADDEAAAHLGRWLFFDPRLSHDGAVSCAPNQLGSNGKNSRVAMEYDYRLLRNHC